MTVLNVPSQGKGCSRLWRPSPESVLFVVSQTQREDKTPTLLQPIQRWGTLPGRLATRLHPYVTL
jgi:hypothetical protein